MTDVRATFSADINLNAVFAQDAALPSTAGSLEELVQAYVNAAVANLGAGNLTWTVLENAATLIPNNGYAINGLSLMNLALPSTSNNNRLILYAYSTAGFRLQQTSPSDQIQVGDKFTTIGISGAIQSIGQSAIELIKLPDRWIGNILQGHFDVI